MSVPLLFLLFTVPIALWFNKESLRSMISIYVWGGIGWVVALILRLIPLAVLQIITVLVLGADLSDQESINEFDSDPRVLIWGPILAGVFEGYFRYYFLNRRKNRLLDHRFEKTVIFGLGWSYFEILSIFTYSAILTTDPDISFSDLLLGIVERISTTFIHVGLSIAVVYALFEFDRKRSLWLAIILHVVYDCMLVVWIVVFGDYDTREEVWALESFFFVLGLTILTFVLMYWKPRKEKQMWNSLKLEENYKSSS